MSEPVARTPSDGALHAPAARRRAERGRLAALAALGLLALGAVCDGEIRVVERAPDPVVVDENGDARREGVDALIAEIEAQRELGFIQHPTLELLAPDDPRVAALLDAARALEACPRGGAAEPDASDLAGRCFPDPSLEWIDCVAPPDLDELRRALRRLLDAQNHPALARSAPLLAGDPGVALRALLAASANGAPVRAGAVDADAALELFELPAIEVERQDTPGDGCVAIAEHFLAQHEDREAPFRTPPLSTKQLVSAKRYRAGERPLLLIGKPPSIEGCSVAGDESVGVARLLVELLAKGGSLPGPLLAGWLGDRGVRFACDDGRDRWIYVVEMSDAVRADALAREIQRLLPDELAGPSIAQAVGRRVVVTSQGLASQGASEWARALATQQLAGFRGLGR